MSSSFGGVVFDAVTDYSVSRAASVPQFVTESGFSISDHITNNPLTVSVNAILTNNRLNTKKETPQARLNDLVYYFNAKSLQTISINALSAGTMAIVGFSYTQSSGQSKDEINVSLSLQQVRTVTTQVTAVIPSTTVTSAKPSPPDRNNYSTEAYAAAYSAWQAAYG